MSLYSNDINKTLEALGSIHSSSTEFRATAGRDWSVQAAFVEGSHLWALLVTGYILVMCVGVVGNVFLLAALCGTGSRSRSLPVRNHLMVNLAAADLLVTAFCVPISACAAASHACWPSFMVSWMCQIGPLLQRTPVAASTLSLALLSLDRWAALRHPRFAQRFREKRFVVLSMISIWILASLVAAPTLWARQWETEQPNSNSSTSTQSEYFSETDRSRNASSIWQWEWSGMCVERWTSDELQIAYVTTYLGTAFVSPALIVAACHASVSQKLTAQLRVLANSSVGERVRRKPQHVIILARDPDPNTAQDDYPRPSRKIVPCDPNSDEDDVFLQMQIKADLESFREISQQQLNNTQKNRRRSQSQLKSYPSLRQNYGRGRPGNPGTSRSSIMISQKPLRAAKNEASIIRAQRRAHRKSLVTQRVLTKQKQPLMQSYSSQSFRSRRRAAKLMAALAAVFVFCWAPYVICALWDIFSSDKSIVQLIIPFALFMGHAHSAINPVVSWRLNRSAFVRFKRQPLLSFLPDWTPFRNFSCRSFGSAIRNCFTCCSSCTDVKADVQNRQDSDSTRRWQNQDHSVTAINHNRDRCSCRYICSSCCSSMFLGCCRGRGRRSSLSDEWNGNTSTNEAALGAFHPKYLSRRPVPDPVSNCHTSHFLK